MRHYIFLLLSIFILLTITPICTVQATPSRTATATNGFINISNIIEDNETINLKGEWLFFSNQFLSYNEIQSGSIQGQTIQVPGQWNLSEFNPQADPTRGYGTYFLRIKIDQIDKPLAISIPVINEAYRLYVDDELISSVGIIGKSNKLTTPRYRQQIIPLHGIESNIINLTLQVANFNDEWGGIGDPITIGKAEVVFQAQKLTAMESMFLSGFLFAVALYNLIIFRDRKSDSLPLIFALLCFTLGLRELFVQNYIILNYFPTLTVTQLIRIEYLTFFIGAPLIMHFNYLSFPKYFNKKVLVGAYIIALLLILAVLLRNIQHSNYILLVMQLLSPLYISYVVYITVVAYRAKQRGAMILLTGSIVMGICVINDILYAHSIIQTAFISSLGLVIYVISQSYMTGVKLNQAIEQSDNLSKRLTRRNATLENLTVRFEMKVKERTTELAQANANLKRIAQTDPLTQVRNRYGMLEIIKQEEARFKRSGITYSIATIDLDHFKSINDKFGHDNGDQVLKHCAQLMQNNIRKQDKLARWGGEEFVILLPETPLYGATIIAEKIRNVIAQTTIIVDDQDIKLTVTIGVVETQIGESFEHAFKRSDMALFRGKEKGRNIVIV